MNAGRSSFVSVLALVGLLGIAGCAASGAPRASGEDPAQANLRLGIGYLRQGRPDRAVESLQRALAQDPRLASAHSTIALAYDQLGNAEDAERHHQRAVRLQPGDATIANSYAVFLCRQSRWPEAEPYFRRAADSSRYATPAAALTNAGHCAADAGDGDRAEAYFREALARDASYPDALAAMMALSYRQGETLQARAFMQRYLEVGSATAQVLLICFDIERALDDRAAAERCAARLREEYPGSAELARLQQLERNAR